MTSRELAVTVPDLLRRAADRHGERPAVGDAHATLSFAELAAEVRRTAAVLLDAGVRRGDRVAIVIPNSTAFVTTVLAVLETGAAAFPINAAARPPEVRRLLAETPVAALAAIDDAMLALAGSGVAVLALDDSRPVVRASRTPAAASAATAAEPSDAALVAYSSGTVARPHLVVRTHANLCWEAENFWDATRLGPADVVLGLVPLSHAHGFGNALLAALRAGAHLVLRPRFQRRATLDLLEREEITAFPTVPFMLRMLASAESGRRRNLGALRWCISAGAPLAPEIFADCRERLGVTVRQLYGLTEAGSVALNTAPLEDFDPASVGTPLGTTRVCVVDERGRAVAAGTEGEIVVHSANAAGGLEQALHTRDRGRISAAGALWITGRTSLFINAAGNKVDPGEVEAVLRAHPAVAEAAVFGVPAPHGEEVVAAAVVLRDACRAEDLRAHCRAALAAYKVPRAIRIRRALPRSPLGKVLIGRLIAEAARD
jgi:long-chain acyl-CoA synthetase